MNYLVQRGKVRQQVINVPDGFPELLSDISREVLRCQPTTECLCQFIIDYLHSVIVTREKANVAKGILERALRKVDEVIADVCICDIPKVKSDLMAKVMEDCFRNFLEKRRCEMRRGREILKFNEIDMLEELIQKCKFSEEEMALSRPVIENAYKRFVEAYMSASEGTDGTEILYQYFRDRELKRVRDQIENTAALRIQSVYRGYVVRKTIQEQICTCTCMVPAEDTDVELKDQAARIIQRFFRNVHSISRTPEIKIDEPCEEPGSDTSAGKVVKVVPDASAASVPPAKSEAKVGGEALHAQPSGVHVPVSEGAEITHTAEDVDEIPQAEPDLDDVQPEGPEADAEPPPEPEPEQPPPPPPAEEAAPPPEPAAEETAQAEDANEQPAQEPQAEEAPAAEEPPPAE